VKLVLLDSLVVHWNAEENANLASVMEIMILRLKELAIQLLATVRFVKQTQTDERASIAKNGTSATLSRPGTAQNARATSADHLNVTTSLESANVTHLLRALHVSAVLPTHGVSTSALAVECAIVPLHPPIVSVMQKPESVRVCLGRSEIR
jgi:hypothetical protein